MDASAEDEILSRLLFERLDYFAVHAFRCLYPGRSIEDETCVKALCRALQDVQEGNTERLLVTMPPRCLKSFCAAVCLPAFALGHNPALKIGVASYSHELAREHTELFLRLVRQPWYRHVFPNCRILESSIRLENIVTMQGGGRRPISIGGSLTGLGLGLLILDDLIKAQDANSPIARDEVERFYRETAVTRFDDPNSSPIVSVMQRLHPEDIANTLIEGGQYHHLNLPAVAPADMVLPLYGENTWVWHAGELLAPNRLSQTVLDRLRRDMGNAAFSAQYLQDPLADESMLVDFKRFHIIDTPFAAQDLLYVVQSIDTAVKIGVDCDYSVITTWGYDGARWCLVDAFRRQLEFADLQAAVLASAETWKPDRILIEDCHTGSALWSGTRGKLKQVIVVPPEGSKIERLSVATGLLYSGEIVFPRNGALFDRLRHEMVAFPGGKHDDMVDSVTQFVGWLRERDMDYRLSMKRTGRPPRRPRPSNPARRL